MADGEPVTLLCNVASAAETRLGLSGGAAGVGLLRTEIPFTGASGWPSEADHLAQLTPVLGLLAGRPAVVRLLDFSGDKIPPFLADQEPGLAALLGAPEALRDQLRAILLAGADTQLAVLVPMVKDLDEVAQVRAALAKAAAEAGIDAPELGIMVEVAATAAAAADFAPAADFFSVGTNDLVQYTLGLDRSQPLATARSAADPRVLRLIADTVAAGHEAGLTVEICGESASVPELAILYVGLGVDELSVAPARLDEIRTTVRSVSAEHATDLAWSLLSGEGGNQHGKLVGGLGGVVA